MKIKLKDITNSGQVCIHTVDRIVEDKKLGKVYICKELYKPHKNIPYMIMECFVEEVIEDGEVAVS